jgi:2-succinyl-6-hydroxy-2,4-cyclohexadiene-1-carboxylate synthase
LPAGVELHRPALLGHGDGGNAGADAGFEGEVDRLARWLRRRMASPCHLAGYSMGGRVALGLLVRHRELFRGATLIGIHPGLAGDAERRERGERDESLARRLEERGIVEFVDRWQALPLFASQRRLPAELLARQREARLRRRPEGLARALRQLGPARMPDLRPALAEVDLPVRLMAGELDVKYRRVAGEMAAALPRATVEIVPGAGHNLLLEAPGAVAAAITRALEGETAP